MQLKSQFLVEAAKAFGATSYVLEFFQKAPVQRNESDYWPLINAACGLCREHRQDCSGMADIRLVAGVFDALLIRTTITDDDLHSGIASAVRFRHWLRNAFPGAREKPDLN